VTTKGHSRNIEDIAAAVETRAELLSLGSVVAGTRYECAELAGAKFTAIAGTGTANGLTILAHDTLDFSFVLDDHGGLIVVNQLTSSADITAAVQFIIDNTTARGVLIHSSDTEYQWSSKINFSRGNIQFFGINSVQLWSLPFEGESGTIIRVTHTGAAAQLTDTTLSTTNTTSGISFQDIAFYGKADVDRSASCFLWDVGGSALFSRGFRFKHCSAKWFKTVFDFTQSAVTAGNTTEKQVGDIQISDSCSFNFNDEVIDTGSLSDHVQINKFKMDDNDISNNTTIGRLTFISGTVVGNIMEGHNDTLELISCRNFAAANNHFEGNTGEFVIKVSGDSRHGRVSPNYYGAVSAKRKVWLQSSYNVTCDDEFTFDQLWDSPSVSGIKFDNTDPTDRSFGVAANLARPEINNPVGHVSRLNSDNHRRTGGAAATQRDTLLGNEQVLMEAYTTAGAGNYTKATKSITANSGDFIAVTFLMQRDNSSDLEPYIQFKINDSTDVLKGSWESPLNNFTKTLLAPDDTDEVLVTVYAKALEAVTSVNIVVFPYGVNPPAGLVAQFSALEYRVAAKPNRLQHSLNLEVLNTVDAAPTSGTWPLGATLHIRAPSAGGPSTLRNVAAGSPGTWKALTLDA